MKNMFFIFPLLAGLLLAGCGRLAVRHPHPAAVVAATPHPTKPAPVHRTLTDKASPLSSTLKGWTYEVDDRLAAHNRSSRVNDMIRLLAIVGQLAGQHTGPGKLADEIWRYNQMLAENAASGCWGGLSAAEQRAVAAIVRRRHLDALGPGDPEGVGSPIRVTSHPGNWTAWLTSRLYGDFCETDYQSGWAIVHDGTSQRLETNFKKLLRQHGLQEYAPR